MKCVCSLHWHISITQSVREGKKCLTYTQPDLHPSEGKTHRWASTLDVMLHWLCSDCSLLLYLILLFFTFWEGSERPGRGLLKLDLQRKIMTTSWYLDLQKQLNRRQRNQPMSVPFTWNNLLLPALSSQKKMATENTFIGAILTMKSFLTSQGTKVKRRRNWIHQITMRQ